MDNQVEKAYRIVLAGVGGQGVLSLAKVILQVATDCGYQVIQSEIHGMSQRGGMVNAHITVSRRTLTAPVVMEGSGDLLIGLEPLESLRYLHLLRRDAVLIVSNKPLSNLPTYPSDEKLFTALGNIPGVTLLDTRSAARELSFKQAAGMMLLGRAALELPFERPAWDKVIADVFDSKGSKVIEKNRQAFERGYATQGGQ